MKPKPIIIKQQMKALQGEDALKKYFGFWSDSSLHPGKNQPKINLDTTGHDKQRRI